MLNWITAAAGVVGAQWIDRTFAILDTPASPTIVVISSICVMVLAFRRPPAPLLLFYAFVALASAIGSLAVGTSWAALTWLPVIIMTFELARLAPTFLLTLTATLLVLNSPVLVMLQDDAGSNGFSGSPLYFAGLVGVVATPVWFRVALAAYGGGGWGRAGAAAASVVTALGVWSALASGSRAAYVALLAAAVVATIRWLFIRPPSRSKLWDVVALVAVVALLVPAVDLGLGAALDDGSSTVFPVLADRLLGTVATLSVEPATPSTPALSGTEPMIADEPGVVRTRLALWWQAARMVLSHPQGYGIGSYQHVNVAHQTQPMLWSANPHSIWALSAVETGVVGVAALLGLAGWAAWNAGRRRSAALESLVAVAVVMSLDVFSSMPVNALLWWAALGAAMGTEAATTSQAQRAVRIVATVAVLVGGTVASVSLAAACGPPCDPIEQYGGNPRLTGGLVSDLIAEADLNDPRWSSLQRRYPIAYWLAAAQAKASPDGMAPLELLRAYPYFSASQYVGAAEALAPSPLATSVASCGLARFFDGRTIWRDWRSSRAELATARAALGLLAGLETGTERDCELAGIPELPIGYVR